jgi:two-component system NtrC family sensor kinase
MAAGIAHELNQPLMGVRGLAEHILIARDRGWQEAEERLFERVAGIVEQADRMVHIIEHVRLFAREAGKPEMSRVDVNDVVGSASGLVSSQLNSRGIDVLFELTRPLPKVRANPYSLEEVLINILSNARDALADTPESGPARTIRILTGERVRRGDQEVTIDIIDTGHGIATDVLARVLEPFYTTKEPGAGTGLGLSVSHSIVEQFGGRLEIESTVGVGTTVRVSLPVAT